MIQDPTSWSLATGSSSTPGGIASSSGAGPSSSSHLFPNGWLSHHNFPTQNQFRISDYAPWSLFPSGESESGIQRGQYSPFASRQPSSPEETAVSSRSRSQGHNQQYARSAYMMDVPGDEANGWRSLAADIDGRQRLVSEEEYVVGESIGTLDCGHDFHSHCIKQWLRQKNACPICKMTGIGS